MTVGTKVDQKQDKITQEDMVRVSSTITEGNKVFRAKDGTCYKMYHSQAWGKYLMPVPDPDGIVLSDFEKNGIRLNDNFPRIPADLWSRWIALCFYMCPQTSSKMSSIFHDQQLEVQVCLLRDAKTLSKWKIVVPKQIVSGTSVKAQLNENIDIETGERYDQFPPEGWLHAGSSHSHNTMGAFFSGTDDRSELTCPGFHAVIGHIDHKNKQYTYASSIVMRKMRKKIELDEVVDVAAMEREFHEDVLEYIDTVVSANRKLYQSKAKEETVKKPLLPWAELDGFSNSGKGLFSKNEGKEEVDVDDIDDLEDLDYFDVDEDKHFPYQEEVSSLVDTALSQGYTMTDILVALRRAKEDYDAFSIQDLLDDDDDDVEIRLTGPSSKEW